MAPVDEASAVAPVDEAVAVEKAAAAHVEWPRMRPSPVAVAAMAPCFGGEEGRCHALFSLRCPAVLVVFA